MTARRLVLLLALTTALAAHAQQNRTSPEILAMLVGPPAAGTLVLDAVVVAGLATTGTGYRGPSILAIVFGSITAGLSLISMGLGLISVDLFPLWLPVGAAGLTFGLGSLALGIYGLTRPPEVAPRLGPTTAAPPRARLLPLFAADRRGHLVAGASLALAL